MERTVVDRIPHQGVHTPRSPAVLMLRLLRSLLRPRRLLLLLAAVALLAAAAGGAAAWRYRAEPHRTAAEQALARRDFAAARDEIALYLQAWPDDARAHLLAARAARRLTRYDEAEDHLRACERLKGDVRAVALERVLADVQRDDLRAEGYLWQRIDAGDPDAPEILEALTRANLDGYRLWRARDCLNRYLQLRPDDLQALLARAAVWEKMLYFDDAAKDYRRAVECHPDDDGARLRFAQNLLVNGTPGEALEQFERLRPRHGDAPAVRLGLAQCRRRLGETDEAARLLDALLAERPDDAAALTERGRVALDQGKADEAEAWLRKAVGRAPHDREAHYNLQQALVRQGKDADADAEGKEVARLDAVLRRLDEVCRTAAARPDDAGLRCEGGLLFLNNGEEAEGVRWLEQAVRLDPSLREAHRALADYYDRAGRPDLAAPHARAAAP
jgi:Tfp pilus assembly protein PilF